MVGATPDLFVLQPFVLFFDSCSLRSGGAEWPFLRDCAVGRRCLGRKPALAMSVGATALAVTAATRKEY